MRVKVLLSVLIILLATGCASQQVRLEMGGLALPDHIHQANLMSRSMFLTSTFILNTKQKEGDEFLEICSFIDYRNNQVFKSTELTSVVLSSQVLNPGKMKYRFYVCIIADDGNIERRDLVYSGNLSRKSINYILPTKEGFSGSILVEIRDQNNNPIFRWLPFRYKVT